MVEAVVVIRGGAALVQDWVVDEGGVCCSCARSCDFGGMVIKFWGLLNREIFQIILKNLA